MGVEIAHRKSLSSKASYPEAERSGKTSLRTTRSWSSKRQHPMFTKPLDPLLFDWATDLEGAGMSKNTQRAYLRDLADVQTYAEHLGKDLATVYYQVTDERLRKVIRTLDEGGEETP